MGIKNTICNSIAVGLLLASGAALAEDTEPTPWYQVDLIVFAQKGAPYAASEHWPADPGVPDLSHARNLTVKVSGGEEAGPDSGSANAAAQQTGEEQSFVLLPDTDLPLDGEYASIRRSRLYEPLLHVAWRQPGLTRENAIPVHIFEGMQEPPPPSEAVAGLTPEPETGPPLPLRLDGSITLILSRYLHVETDLIYRAPITVQVPSDPFTDAEDLVTAVSSAGVTGAPPVEDLTEPAASGAVHGREMVEQRRMQGFRMQQSRRMRSTEIHYLDHPMYGVIVTVTPYERPQLPAVDATRLPGKAVEPGQPVDLRN